MLVEAALKETESPRHLPFVWCFGYLKARKRPREKRAMPGYLPSFDVVSPGSGKRKRGARPGKWVGVPTLVGIEQPAIAGIGSAESLCFSSPCWSLGWTNCRGFRRFRPFIRRPCSTFSHWLVPVLGTDPHVKESSHTTPTAPQQALAAPIVAGFGRACLPDGRHLGFRKVQALTFGLPPFVEKLIVLEWRGRVEKSRARKLIVHWWEKLDGIEIHGAYAPR